MVHNVRRGISTMFASILLVIMVVMGVAVIHAYTMGYVGGFGGQKLMGAMVLDAVTVEANSPNLIVMIRNIGNTRLEISDAYVNGVKVNVTCLPYPVEEGKTGLVTITNTQNFASGVTYTAKLFCRDNVQLTFEVKT